MLHESDRSIPWLNTDFLQNDIFENSKHLLNESTRNSRIHTRRHSKHMEEKRHITRKQSVISVINTGNLLAAPQSNFRNSIKLTTKPHYPELPNNCVSTSRKDLSHKSTKRNFKISANLLNPPKCSKDHAAFVNSKNSLFFRNKKFREKANELKRNTVARRRHARSTFSAQDCAKQCVKVYENPFFKDQHFEKNKDRFSKENQQNADIHTGFGHCSSVQYSADFQNDKDFKMIQKLSKASLFKYSKNYSRVLSNSHENSHEISQSGEQAIQQNSSKNVTNSLAKALSKNQGRNMLTNRVSHLGLTNNSHDLEDFLRSTVEKTFRPARIYLNNPFTERSQGPSS
ncbi:unnamed protein product [Moneuplotes crassus]|uniref:Uncharacterized protein n=1 Tax=Euplotes crassus TaxID=5936 RepID=A0AAD1Y8Z4_EUPCR|nr:unnamed protein product [Moneuplotes crassus]